MIKFSDKQWENVKDNYKKWWKNELGRPILPCVIWGIDPGEIMPESPLLSFSNCNDLTISPKQIIKRYDYELSSYEYYGEAFPIMQTMQFGPGIVAGFLGCELKSANSTVWFHPKENLPIDELHFEYDENNIWLNRIQDIYREGFKLWGGNVIMGIPDLGGALDILASFRGTNDLLMDLYDAPQEVQRCLAEIECMWRKYYSQLTIELKEGRGYTDWSGIYYDKPSYMMQSDFSYMISNDMFREFALPELERTASFLDKAWYHLDGEGELAHLDDLLKSKAIAGIQWVPGEGTPKNKDWSDVYAKIGKAGKKVQAYYGLDEYFTDVLKNLPVPDLLQKMQFGYSISQKKEALARLSALGVKI